ncbi:MAG: hypothetical protein A2275_05900 [Bacteroidetes bacterium RIFOXYA12_FULL_35_11]|nr:MAG: hypothetical protein A2X01_00180 [Bacteroidetes bacterium GWF2_35_48]OFY78884.1 MAG: hypothetical protein A2275_05900 [Bacteroidetes bacterium RIFOXYA12_FULL_35_11]OFY94439.1 MAG: hypothetical protein A2309_06305 [Bacteroidetes bacterium RIFOXYB2_FULL_35_7]OFZ04622.1 MAG: hypothetical protein A2491_11660 [Bacteroidetes bacterium RIFOXYC12_FULL_35_7]
MNTIASENNCSVKFSKLNYIIVFTVFIISLFNLIQWFFAAIHIIELSQSYMPMAPLTAIFFILICIYLIFLRLVLHKKGVYYLAKGILVLIILFCSINVSNYVFTLNLDFEKLLISTKEVLNNQPVGKMSPVTGGIFILICVFLLLYSNGLSPRHNFFLGNLSLIIVLSGFVLLLGYLYNAPLLYASNVIPVSFLASFLFFLTGIVIFSLMKLDFYPFSLFTKTKVGIQLMCTILPIVITYIALNGILTANIFLSFRNPTLISALLLIFVMIALSYIILSFSNKFGVSIEQAEKKLITKNDEYAKLNDKLTEKNEQYFALNEEYQALNEELERKVIMRTRELKETNYLLEVEITNKQNVIEKEKELNRVKSQFITVVSHEFRTPLAGISSSVQLLQKFGSKWDEIKRIEMYNRIHSSLRYANILIDGVSLIGKDDLGKIPINRVPINFQALCNQVISDVIAVNDFNVDIRVRFENIISDGFTDESLLRHILTNLISNGVKYSDRNPIDLLVEKKKEDFIKFSIKDNGIGIPEEDLKYIFTPFHRAGNVNDIKGSGLGLSITKRCVDLLKGEISIESELGKGTTVVFEIPIMERESKKEE